MKKMGLLILIMTQLNLVFAADSLTSMSIQVATAESVLNDEDCGEGIFCAQGGSAHYCSNICDFSTCGRPFSFCLPPSNSNSDIE